MNLEITNQANLPLVSILIPSYNHEIYIINTLDSVLEDTYSNIEIVIIDDGSSDNSVNLIQDWIKEKAPKKIKFKSRENKGLCHTLNELVDWSEGLYLVILASDDILCNNSIEKRIKILEKNKDKLVLVSDAEVINNKGVTIFNSMLFGFHNSNKFNYSSDDKLMNEIIFNFSISGAVVMCNRKIYNIIGPYPGKLKAEDMFFYIKSACKKTIIFDEEVVSKYRIHQTNTSGLNPELTKTIINTYLITWIHVPGFVRKLKVIKRVLGLIFYNYFK